MRKDEISKRISSYMTDENAALYAMVLYGSWGSGKTYYCEHDLRAALKLDGRKVCRVSLFGVNDIDDLCGRILISYFHLNVTSENETGVKRATKALMANLSKVAGSAVLNKLSRLGIQLALRPKDLIELLDMERTLVVLDDCERSDFAKNEGLFLGLVNEIVENRGWHVVVVRNSSVSFESPSVEKAVFAQLEFEPDPVDLYEALVEPKLCFDASLDVDMQSAIIRGIERTHVNARALMRAVPAIGAVLNSEIISDGKLSAEGRASALADFVTYAIRSSAGDAPRKPEKSNGVTMSDDPLVAIDYEHYECLVEALNGLSSGRDADPETIQRCFEAYLIKRYPESPEDVEMKRLYDCWAGLGDMNDDEVSSLARELAGVLERGNCSYHWFYKLCRMVMTLIDLGFDERLSRDNLFKSLERMDKRNLVQCVGSLKRERQMSRGLYGPEVDGVMNDLIACLESEVVDSCRKQFNEEFGAQEINEETGTRLAVYLKDSFALGAMDKLLVATPEYIAQTVCLGNAASQLALREFFYSAKKSYPSAFDCERTLSWLKEIDSHIASNPPQSRMGMLRARWIREDLEQLAKILDNAG